MSDQPDITDTSYEAAMWITDQREADKYFKKLVLVHLDCRAAQNQPQSVDEAEKIVRSNLGYYAGYFHNATRERVERLFKCEHPIFGSIAQNGPPTPEQAFEIGKRWSEENLKKRN